MDHHRDLASGHLAEARRHIMALRNMGMSEAEVMRQVSGEPPHPQAAQQCHQSPQLLQLPVPPQQQQQQQHQQQQQQQGPQPPLPQPPQQSPVSPHSQQGPLWRTHNARLSVSSTNSASTGRQSIFSTASRASFDSVATRYEFQPPLPAIPSPSSVGHIQQSPIQQEQQQQPQPPQQQQQQQESEPRQETPVTAIQQQKPQASAANGSEKIYSCTSCDTGFKRKFDWKRHEEEFHERFKKYPCPDCNRIMWGSNSFNQHHKVAHGCKTCPHAELVVKHTKRRTAWGCGFCAAFLPARERFFDHVAQHFEKERKTKAEWFHSNVVYGLLHQRGIHEVWKSQKAQRERDHPDRTEKFSWDPAKTGRAQGFMEGECGGKLQDLLEFFGGGKEDAKNICQMAYDQADILYANPTAATIKTEPGRQSTQSTQSTQSIQSIQSMNRPLSMAAIPNIGNAANANTTPQLVVTPVPWNSPLSPPPAAPQMNAPPATGTTASASAAAAVAAAAAAAASPTANPGPGFTVAAAQAAPDTNMYRYSLDRALPPIPADTPMTMDIAAPNSTASDSISFHSMGSAPMIYDTPMNDWQSFATTMVDDPMTTVRAHHASQPMMAFDPNQFFTNNVWDESSRQRYSQQ